ncbi:hypothetical protein SALBM311S_09381 [Streptomyces alboniger]
MFAGRGSPPPDPHLEQAPVLSHRAQRVGTEVALHEALLRTLLLRELVIVIGRENCSHSRGIGRNGMSKVHAIDPAGSQAGPPEFVPFREQSAFEHDGHYERPERNALY